MRQKYEIWQPSGTIGFMYMVLPPQVLKYKKWQYSATNTSSSDFKNFNWLIYIRQILAGSAYEAIPNMITSYNRIQNVANNDSLEFK